MHKNPIVKVFYFSKYQVIMHKIALIEPQWWEKLLHQAIEIVNNNPWLEQFAPIGADIFVFLYPIFLVALYLKGIIKKEKEAKEGALFIFFSCLFCTLINIGIQRFFYKQRPNAILYDDTEETILHQFLPESSFPSDHAVVSMSFALATLFRGYKAKNKKIIFAGYSFVVISLVMCCCRIFTVVHWPSDIIGGILLSLILTIVFSQTSLFSLMKKYLITPCINLQEKIFKR